MYAGCETLPGLTNTKKHPPYKLDEPGDRVRYMYSEYWELSGRFELAQIYDEARYDIYGLLRLHKIVNGLVMNEQDLHKVMELAKYDELH